MSQQTFLADFVSDTKPKKFEHHRTRYSDDLFLGLLQDGFSQSMIAQKLEKPRSFVNYRVKRLESEGKIVRRADKTIKIGGKTRLIKNYPIIYDVLVSVQNEVLVGVQKLSSGAERQSRGGRLSEWFPHHFKVTAKYDGVQPSAGATKSWGMRNWRVFEWSQYPSVTLLAKPRTLEIVVWKAEGASIEERVEAGYQFARRFAEWFAGEHALTLLTLAPLNLRHWVLNNEKLSARVISLLDLKRKPPFQGLTTDLSHKGLVEAHGVEGEASAKELEWLLRDARATITRLAEDNRNLAVEVSALRDSVAALVQRLK